MTPRAAEVFKELEDVEPSEREERLAVLRKSDAALAEMVESLFEAHDDRVLGTHDIKRLARGGLGGVVGEAAGALGVRPGDRLGPYEIVSLVGSGGFGEVYEGRRTEPFAQRVAVKVIKPGMGTREVLARFEHERRALAKMSHPSVARVFDGGVSPGGQPYFVMEFVEGSPITAACDGAGMTVRQRLTLMIQVCDAVDHAHSKGIIHRDLKPGNVLLELAAGAALPKVIDFGISKAMTPEEGEGLTVRGGIIGTPEYMAPEQFGGGDEIDTRSDVYALGALLYHLMVGVPPRDGAWAAGLARGGELAGVLEREPMKPVARFAGMSIERREAIAACRATTPAQLKRELDGELSWIVGRALEAERERRYRGAAELGEDLGRYLRGEPVRAAPPSRVYRVRKFVRRHRVAVSAGTVVAAAVVGAAVVSMVSAHTARTQREIADAVSGLLNDEMLESLDRGDGGAMLDLRVVEVLDKADAKAPERLAGRPEVEAALRAKLAVGFNRLGVHERVLQQIARIGGLDAGLLRGTGDEAVELRSLQGEAMYRTGRAAEGVLILRPLLEELRSERGPHDAKTLEIANQLAGLLKWSAELDEAATLYTQVLGGMLATRGPDDRETLIARHNLALIPMARAELLEPDEAEGQERERLNQEAMTRMASVADDFASRFGEEDQGTLFARAEEARLLSRTGRDAEATLLYETVIATMTRALSSDHWKLFETRANLALHHKKQRRFSEAAAILGVLADVCPERFGVASNEAYLSALWLADCLEGLGRREEAARALERWCEGVSGEDERADRARERAARLRGIVAP